MPRSQVSDRWTYKSRRRKIFVLAASVVYGLALFVIAIASHFSGFLVGMAISGLGFGVYAAVDLGLVVDVLPDKRNAAKDLGVFNIAGDRAGHPGDRPRRRQLQRAVHGRRTLRHHRSVRHLAREACPMSLRGWSPAPAGPAGLHVQRPGPLEGPGRVAGG